MTEPLGLPRREARKVVGHVLEVDEERVTELIQRALDAPAKRPHHRRLRDLAVTIQERVYELRERDVTAHTAVSA
jgi:hypothetical protein